MLEPLSILCAAPFQWPLRCPSAWQTRTTKHGTACSEASIHGQCFAFLLTFSAGPGIAPTVKTGEEVGFVVDAKTAGRGKVTCVILTPDGTEAEADVIENEDGTYDIFYTAAKPGTYVIYVRFGGVDIPNSPFTVMVSVGFLLLSQRLLQKQSQLSFVEPLFGHLPSHP